MTQATDAERLIHQVRIDTSDGVTSRIVVNDLATCGIRMMVAASIKTRTIGTGKRIPMTKKTIARA